ncbi:hypothetical protein GCM10009760_36510 [Kitasatospora kazusensis]|uniref:Uncharacterized protein n=1 Tax=Kitasatospora kazusensis TaxID=407974 RepID=A0ABN2ZSC2_9ACTN
MVRRVGQVADPVVAGLAFAQLQQGVQAEGVLLPDGPTPESCTYRQVEEPVGYDLAELLGP